MVRIPKGSVFIHIQELNISLNYLGKMAFSLMLNICHVAVCTQPLRTVLVGIFVAFLISLAYFLLLASSQSESLFQAYQEIKIVTSGD